MLTRCYHFSSSHSFINMTYSVSMENPTTLRAQVDPSPKSRLRHPPQTAPSALSRTIARLRRFSAPSTPRAAASSKTRLQRHQIHQPPRSGTTRPGTPRSRGMRYSTTVPVRSCSRWTAIMTPRFSGTTLPTRRRGMSTTSPCPTVRIRLYSDV
jgi:hypothetical protein